MPHVVLDPDGTQKVGLAVIVEGRTGVTYEQQCGGYATEQRTVEGFLAPIGVDGVAKGLRLVLGDIQRPLLHISTRQPMDARRDCPASDTCRGDSMLALYAKWRV
jgi:hypothetical protein